MHSTKWMILKGGTDIRLATKIVASTSSDLLTCNVVGEESGTGRLGQTQDMAFLFCSVPPSYPGGGFRHRIWLGQHGQATEFRIS